MITHRPLQLLACHVHVGGSNIDTAASHMAKVFVKVAVQPFTNQTVIIKT